MKVCTSKTTRGNKCLTNNSPKTVSNSNFPKTSIKQKIFLTIKKPPKTIGGFLLKAEN